ncbi:MAG TPA: hypothetical protein V6C88_10150 [Chroococcidiopsis sp.]
MKSSTTPPASQPASSAAKSSTPSNYAPSVPISVYRELAAELQATKTMLDSVNSQNQQISQQNQLLRQELEKVVQQGQRLQQVLQTGNPNPAPVEARVNAERLAEQIRTSQFSVGTPAGFDDEDGLDRELFTEQPEITNVSTKSRPPKDLGGLWLTLTIVLIVVTAFGAGFILIRPFLSNNR